MSAQAVLQHAEPYLDELEQRLAKAVEHCPGVVAAVGRNAVDAGGKRLRPLLVHLTSMPPWGELEARPPGDDSRRFHTGVHPRPSDQ